MELQIMPPARSGRKKGKGKPKDTQFMSFDSVLMDAGIELTPGFGDESSIQSSVVARLSAWRLCSALPMMVLLPPIIVAEACSEHGLYGKSKRVRRLARALTEKRLIVGWLVLLLTTSILMVAVQSAAAKHSVIVVHSAVLLSVPTLIMSAALLDAGSADIRDANGVKRRPHSELLLDVRPNCFNVVQGLTTIWIALQYVVFMFGVPIASHGGHGEIIVPDRSHIWTERVDTVVFDLFHFVVDLVYMIPFGGSTADVLPRGA
jgi:hypothetical protein